MRRAFHTIQRSGHLSHLVGVFPLNCKFMPCEHSGSLKTGGRDLDLHGLSFVPPDCAFHLLVDMGPNTVSSNNFLLPLLAGRDTAFEEALNWLNFVLTVDPSRSYVLP